MMRQWLGDYFRIGGEGRALWGNVKGMKKLATQQLFQAISGQRNSYGKSPKVGKNFVSFK